MGLEDLDLGDHYRFVKDVVKDESVDVTTDGGVKKECIRAGSGETGRPGDGSRVVVHATGRLDDGTVIEDSRGGEPLTFRLGRGRMTQGFDLAVKSMRRGEKAKVTLRPKYAYGHKGCEERGVPPGSNIIWEIELLEFVYFDDVSEDKLGGVLKEIVRFGESTRDRACYESTVVIDIAVATEDSVDSGAGDLLFERSGWSVVVGDRDAIPRGVEDGIVHMAKGETAIIHIPPAYACCGSFEAKAGTRLRATITLHEVHTPKDCWGSGESENWDLTLDEICDGAERRKQEANQLYKLKKFEMAKRKYRSGVRLLRSGRCGEVATGEAETGRVNALLLILHNNLAAVHLSAQEWVAAVAQATSAIDLQDNTKARLRRAKALNQTMEFDKAKLDLDAVLQAEPDHAEAKKELETLKRKRQQHNQKERAAFGKMFGTKEP
eukprot:TRINITY_DN7083_c0_g1_i1.p1 TRINITY_DN7083_c0_g1~~TRINITY_DN7083_c0_g1_i1.p1  ORF type:complete len:436 (+),score=132.30 TRINITY_DN7083_c0_g1_i1:78-1385(+)